MRRSTRNNYQLVQQKPNGKSATVVKTKFDDADQVSSKKPVGRSRKPKKMSVNSTMDSEDNQQQ